MSFEPRRFKKTWNRVQQERTQPNASGRNARFSPDDVREQQKRRALRELKLLGVKLAVGVAFALFLNFYVAHVVKNFHHPASPSAAAAPVSGDRP